MRDLCPKPQCHIHLQRQGLQLEQREGLWSSFIKGSFLYFGGTRKARLGGENTSAVTPTFLSLLETAGLFHGLLERFRGEAYKQVRRLGSEGT